jgi:Co/Zn/Cd efflux system component
LHNHAHTHFNELTKQTVSRLALSLSITLLFVFVEIAAGVFANSLALLTDAAHNFTDVLELGLSWLEFWLRWPIRPRWSSLRWASSMRLIFVLSIRRRCKQMC